jgi:hypothetical protein
MIDVSIHNPKFESKHTRTREDGTTFCFMHLHVPHVGGMAPATIFIQNADDARELSKQFDAIADILSGVTQ